MRNASRYRALLEAALPDIFESVQTAYRQAETRQIQVSRLPVQLLVPQFLAGGPHTGRLRCTISRRVRAQGSHLLQQQLPLSHAPCVGRQASRHACPPAVHSPVARGATQAHVLEASLSCFSTTNKA